jgi:hypothetical protein
MAQVYLFGVVKADIGRYLPRIAFDTETAPTALEADEIVTDHAADLCAYLYGMGVNVESLAAAPTSALYRTCQRFIILRLAAQVMRMRNQNDTTAAEAWDGEADRIIERLRKLPQDMGAERPTGVNSPNILHSNATYAAELYAKQMNSQSRLAINAAQDKM